MNPGTPKRDENISQVLDAWIKERRAILDHGVDDMPAEFRITALRIIMANHLERFDGIGRDSRECADSEHKVEKTIDYIKDYATELRLRKIRTTPSGFVYELGDHEKEGEKNEEDDDQEDWSWWTYDQAIQGLYAMAKRQVERQRKKQIR